MKKTEKIIIVIALILSVVSVGMNLIGKSKDSPKLNDLGNIFKEQNAYSEPIKYTSSTLSAGVATLLIERATSSRTRAGVCYASSSALGLSGYSTSSVWIYAQGTSTGIVQNLGHQLYLPYFITQGNLTGSSIDNCKVFDEMDSYTGQVWGIANITSTVLIESRQN